MKECSRPFGLTFQRFNSLKMNNSFRMNTEDLKQYFLDWRKNRLDKLAPAVIEEFKSHPNRYEALHHIAITKDDYPFQEYGSWLAGHIIPEFYATKVEQKMPEIIDAFLTSTNHSVKRNLMKIILNVPCDYKSGELLDKAFFVLSSADENIALRSYSFSYLLQWMEKYPEIQIEIDSILTQWPELFTSGAMQSCLKKYRKCLK